jgi:rhodanese-related sulfurtransferase/CRP-like cAMP-binding protein
LNTQWNESNVDSMVTGVTAQGESVEDCQLLSEGLHTAATLVPLKALKPNFLQYLFANAQVRALFAGQTLFEANSYDKRHLYLLHGQLELRYGDGRTELVHGTHSEFPIAHAAPRPCTAVAQSDCSVLIVDSEQLDRTLSWSQIAQYLMAEIAVERDYDEDNAWMQTVLCSNLFFKVPPINVEQIFSRLEPVVVLAGEAVIRQGEIGDCCYFIKEGAAVVTRRAEFSNDAGEAALEHVADIGVGRCFGEDALVYETVRNANVTMTSNGVLMRLDKKDFMLLLKESVAQEVPFTSLYAQGVKPVLIDVRTEEEYVAGHLDAAANIPLSLLCLKKRLLSKEKNYVLYCDTGRRSRAAAWLLAREGYQTAALEGGVNGSGAAQQLRPRPDYLLRNGEIICAS